MKPRISDESKTATMPGFVPPYQNVIAIADMQMWQQDEAGPTREELPPLCKRVIAVIGHASWALCRPL